MTSVRMRTWQYKCDECGELQIVTSYHKKRPPDWGYRRVTIGLTGSPLIQDLCQVHYKEHE